MTPNDGGKIAVSQTKLDQMKCDLEGLKQKSRDVAEVLMTAAHGYGGELADNQEWWSARKELDDINESVTRLEREINSAIIVHNGGAYPNPIVDVGATVYLRDLMTNREEIYTIVGPLEADPAKGKINLNCLMGEGLRGCKTSDPVTIRLPKGERRFQITGIKYE